MENKKMVCDNCLEEVFSFKEVEDLVYAECQMCGSEVSFENKEKKSTKTKITK